MKSGRVWHKFLFTLFLFSIPTQIAYHFWPDWSLVLGRRIDYLSPTIFLSDIFLILSLITWATTETKLLIQKIKVFFINYKKLALTVLLFILLTLLTTSSPPLTLYGLFKIAEVVYLIFYIYKNNFSHNKISKILIASGGFSLLLSVSQVFHNGSIGGVLWFLGERDFNLTTPNIAKNFFCFEFLNFCQYLIRPYATFPHPNVLAGFFGVTILSTIKSNLKPLIKQFLTLLFFLGIILTNSRTALIFSLATLTLLFINKRVSVAHWKILTFGLVIVSLAGLTILTFPVNKNLNNYINANESLQIRRELNLATLTLIANNPVFGTGLNTFLTKVPDVLVYKTLYFIQPTHNIYLLSLSSIGFVGLGLTIFLIFQIILKLKSGTFSLKNFYPLLFLLLVGLFDHYPITLQQGILLLGLTISFLFTREKRI